MVKSYEWYPTEDDKKYKKRHTPKAPKARKSLQAGTVLILLAGRFRGKRVVFLKSLKSGLIAVTGPYKINGVPVKRVNPVYTVSTSTKVDVSGVKVDTITDDTFKKATKAKQTRSHKFFAEDIPKNTITDARKKLQKEVDTAILSKVKDTMVKKYLNARFSLTKNDAPHEMKF